MKFLKFAGITALVLMALSALGVGYVFAQRPTPPPWGPGTGMGGMMNGYSSNNGSSSSVPQWMNQMHQRMTQNGNTGRGMMGGAGFDMSAMRAWMSQSGGMHTQVWNALAGKLGLSPAELTAQMQSGKSLAQLGQDKGVSVQDLAATMETAMEAGLKNAVQTGVLTQAQADAMTQAMDGRYEWMIQNMGSMLPYMGPGWFGGAGTSGGSSNPSY
jgi:hypothetical protein